MHTTKPRRVTRDVYVICMGRPRPAFRLQRVCWYTHARTHAAAAAATAAPSSSLPRPPPQPALRSSPLQRVLQPVNCRCRRQWDGIGDGTGWNGRWDGFGMGWGEMGLTQLLHKALRGQTPAVRALWLPHARPRRGRRCGLCLARMELVAVQERGEEVWREWWW